MGNVSHLVTRTAAFESSLENGLAEGTASKDRQFVTALARGLDILRAFHAGEGMLGNQEIAHRTGLPKPTVARLTHTLTELGYLNYIRRFRKYELGASVLALGYAAISSMDVRRASRAPLEQLAHALNASTALGGRDRHSMIYLEACRVPRSWRSPTMSAPACRWPARRWAAPTSSRCRMSTATSSSTPFAAAGATTGPR